MDDIVLKYITAIGTLVISWPAVLAIALIVFRDGIRDFIINLRKGKFGPVQFEAFERLVERGHSSLSTVEALNVEIAKSRIIELEMTQGLMPNPKFNSIIAKMKLLVEDLEKNVSPSELDDNSVKKKSARTKKT